MNGGQFNILQSEVGGALISLVNSGTYRLVAADPLDACSDLVNLQGVTGKASPHATPARSPLSPGLSPLRPVLFGRSQLSS